VCRVGEAVGTAMLGVEQHQRRELERRSGLLAGVLVAVQLGVGCEQRHLPVLAGRTADPSDRGLELDALEFQTMPDTEPVHRSGPSDEGTPEERLWCLDGDAPTWAGLTFLGEDGYHRPLRAAEVERVGSARRALRRRASRRVVGNATAFPGLDGPGRHLGPELEERVGDAIGRELRAVGRHLTGAVCVNVLRHPAWGRAQETYGEDPHHVGELGAALTRGLQRHVMACVKHFACNSMENARFSVDIEVDEVALHEVYLPHFRRIVDEGVASVMSAYNS
jgi:hypothetical protein